VLAANARIGGVGGNVHTVHAAVGVGGGDAAAEPAMMAVRRLDLNASSHAHLGNSNFGSLSLVGCETRGISAHEFAEGNFGSADEYRECQASSNSTAGNEHEWVRIVSLDSFAWFDGHCPALIKIDVEGMESAVLAGAVRTLRACKPVLHVENNQAASSPAIITAIASLDYDMFWEVSTYSSRHNYLGVLQPSVFERSQRGLPLFNSQNILAVPRGYDRAQLSATTAAILDVLTPVDVSVPLLIDVMPVEFLDNEIGGVTLAHAQYDGVSGVLVQRNAKMLHYPFHLKQS
jgi:FkbM family methyltransferase